MGDSVGNIFTLLKDNIKTFWDKIENKTKKRFFISIIIVIIFMIFILIIMKINGNNITYLELENRVKIASKNYFEIHKNKLPDEGKSITLKISTLEKKDVKNDKKAYIKNIKKLVKDNTCNGYVEVTNFNDNYKYQPFIECNNFKTEIFIEKFLDKNKIKNENSFNSGLYKINNELVFRGDNNINNYVKFSNQTWRILKFDEERNFYLILDSIDDDTSYTWDDRYNIEEKTNQGINDYTKSRLYISLINLYNENKIIKKENKKYLAKFNVCLDKVSPTFSYKQSCINFLNNQYITLPTAMDFMNATLDNTCTLITQEQCSNYNFLSMLETNWWLITANSENTFEVYKVGGMGYAEKTSASDISFLRYVIKIKNDVLYESGNGSKKNPYTLRY